MIYKIRVILDSEEDVFRDIAIEGQSTLEDFHNIITQAFGFLGNEMASFYTCDERWNQEEEIALFDMEDGGSAIRLMKETLIADLLTEDTPKLIYVYDFLSMWTFFVELADVEERQNGLIYPMVLFSFGELPDAPTEKKFEADPTFDFEEPLDSYGDLDFDENWN